MKLLHLSDLHLGRRFYGLSFLPQQASLLQQILQCAEENQIEAILIAGDIYDKTIPSVEAVSLFDSFLTKLAEKQIAVFLINGNHDSPERLQFGSRLLQNNQIHIAGMIQSRLQTVTLQDAYGALHISMLPFFKLAAAATCFPEESFSTLLDAVKYILQQTDVPKTERHILLYHGFVLHDGTVPECSDSELQLGGLQLVDAAIFSDFDYVALGHIHKPQWVKKGKIRYSGSLMKYSFSEYLQKKSITILDCKEKGNLTIETKILKPEQDLRVLRGHLEELLTHAVPSKDWIRVELTDTELIPYALERLRAVYPNVLELVYLHQMERLPLNMTEAENVPERSMMELLETFYQNIYQYDIRKHSDAYAVLEEIIKEAEKTI